MQAAIKPFIWKSPAVVSFGREPSKNRPTLNQWLRLIAVGLRLRERSAPPRR
jgi:hypothetical protein